MVSLIDQKKEELQALCRKYHVARLEIFGSAATGDFNSSCNDIDFLVTFDDSIRHKRFDNYFALHQVLTQLFDLPVDLVEPGGLKNPYFIKRLNQSRKLIYDATT